MSALFISRNSILISVVSVKCLHEDLLFVKIWREC